MKRITIRRAPSCDICLDEGRVEQMTLRHDGEPSYRMVSCIHTEEGLPEPRIIRMTELESTTKFLNILATLNQETVEKFVFSGKEKLVSPTRPSARLAF